MSGVDARYLGLTANQLAKIATDLKSENDKLHELCRGIWDAYMDSPCEECSLKGLPACADCPIFAREIAVVVERDK